MIQAFSQFYNIKLCMYVNCLHQYKLKYVCTYVPILKRFCALISSAFSFISFPIFNLYSINNSTPASSDTDETPGPDSDGNIRLIDKNRLICI